ncbi:MAG: hypothetical protein GY941_05220 [Planctomycetes bacterium]|nr:hypothetical protein [Planctomycetota bacterium]
MHSLGGLGIFIVYYRPDNDRGEVMTIDLSLTLDWETMVDPDNRQFLVLKLLSDEDQGQIELSQIHIPLDRLVCQQEEETQ